MGNIVFHCPKCDQKIKAPDIMAGEVGDCPNCQTPVIIPNSASSQEKPTPPSRKFPIGPKPDPPAPKARFTDMGKKPTSDKSVPVSPLRESEIVDESIDSAPSDGSPEITLKRPEKSAVADPEPAPPKQDAEQAVKPAPTRPEKSASESKSDFMPPPEPPRDESAPPDTQAKPGVGPVEHRTSASAPAAEQVAPKPRGAASASALSKPAPRTSSPTSRPDSVAPARKAEMMKSAPVPDMGDPDADLDRLSLGMDYDDTSKPAALAVIPALLSLIPGLGQAYNLNVKKAVLFAILFLGSVAVAIFKPDYGAPAVFLTIFLAMGDAYGTARGGGFFSGTGRGILLAVRTYGFLLGLLLWMALSALFCDAIAARNQPGASIVATVDLGGTGVAARTVNPWVAAGMVLGSALLLFFLQGFGRKLIWARKRPTHFMFSMRVFLSAVALTGLLATASRLMATETAGKTLAAVFNLPLAILHRVLALPQTVGGMLDKTWPSLVPGILEPATTAVQAFGRSVALSFASFGNVYRFVLLAGLIGIVPLFLRSMLRLARDLPGYGDWMDMWMQVTRERSRHLRSEWQAFREERAAAWERRQTLAESVRKEVAVMNATADRRFARLEDMASRLAEHLGVAMPPPEEIPHPSLAEETVSTPGIGKEKLKAGASKALMLSRTAAAGGSVYLVRAAKSLAGGARALKKNVGQAATRFRDTRRESARIKAELKATEAESKPKAATEKTPEVSESTVKAEPKIAAATPAPKSMESSAAKPAPAVNPPAESVKPTPLSAKQEPSVHAPKPEPKAEALVPPPARREPLAVPSAAKSAPEPVAPKVEPPKPTPLSPKPTPTPLKLAPELAKTEPALEAYKAPKPDPETAPVKFSIPKASPAPEPVKPVLSPKPSEPEQKASEPIKLTPSEIKGGKDGVIKLKPVSKSGNGGVIKLG